MTHTWVLTDSNRNHQHEEFRFHYPFEEGGHQVYWLQMVCSVTPCSSGNIKLDRWADNSYRVSDHTLSSLGDGGPRRWVYETWVYETATAQTIVYISPHHLTNHSFFLFVS